jgi:hypothetical protein
MTSSRLPGMRVLGSVRLNPTILFPATRQILDDLTITERQVIGGSVERFMQTMRGKSPDAEMLSHLRAIHEHVLSLPSEAEGDPEGMEGALLLEMQQLVAQVSELTGA